MESAGLRQSLWGTVKYCINCHKQLTTNDNTTTLDNNEMTTAMTPPQPKITMMIRTSDGNRNHNGGDEGRGSRCGCVLSSGTFFIFISESIYVHLRFIFFRMPTAILTPSYENGGPVSFLSSLFTLY